MLRITRGLPGSGKTTATLEWVREDPENRVRVNRDDIRFQLFGAYSGPTVDENLVTKVERETVKTALAAGKDVTVDATHLAARYVKRWIGLDPDFEIVDFAVDPDVCVARDESRRLAGNRSVGEKVIRDMAKRYHIGSDGKLPKVDVDGLTGPGANKFQVAPPYSHNLPDAIIVDTDGTVADLSHRNPYDTSKYAQDGVFEDVAATIRFLAQPYVVIGVSGRDEEFRDVTLAWWKGNVMLEPDEFYMRPKGDLRNDAVVKSELFDKYIAGRYNVVGVFDDRLRVVRMWHQKGLTTYRVGDPDADF